jgi:hypothetical protein
LLPENINDENDRKKTLPFKIMLESYVIKSELNAKSKSLDISCTQINNLLSSIAFSIGAAAIAYQAHGLLASVCSFTIVAIATAKSIKSIILKTTLEARKFAASYVLPTTWNVSTFKVYRHYLCESILYPLNLVINFLEPKLCFKPKAEEIASFIENSSLGLIFLMDNLSERGDLLIEESKLGERYRAAFLKFCERTPLFLDEKWFFDMCKFDGSITEKNYRWAHFFEFDYFKTEFGNHISKYISYLNCIESIFIAKYKGVAAELMASEYQREGIKDLIVEFVIPCLDINSFARCLTMGDGLSIAG